jgi:stage V sporulation protein AD
MRNGKYVIEFENRPSIIGWSSVVGQKESEGPLGNDFDMVLEDAKVGKNTWEEAESKLHKTSIGILLDKTGLKDSDIDCIFAGDLLNQCSSSGFGIRGYDIPLCGMYGACSTSVLTMITAAVAVNCGAMNKAISSTSSHFCAAEKQFRYPLEYGGQRPPTSQWTVTGSGSALISAQSEKLCPKIERAIYGRIVDKGITDANNMGAAMAPAAAQTISDFFNDTGTSASDYDMVLTGDLGKIGTELLHDLLEKEYNINIRDIHHDTGLMMYYIDEQDVHSGGSGCGCCGTVMCSKILNDLNEGKLNRVLVVATGALLSTVSPFQGESIPGIAHGILLTSGRDGKNE